MFSGTTSQTTRATLTTSPLTKASQKLALGCALTAAGEAFLTSQVFAKIILALFLAELIQLLRTR